MNTHPLWLGRLALGFLLAVQAGFPALTATLTIDLQISNIVHHFNPPWDGMPGSVVDELVYDRAGLTNVNLSVYDTFELRLFAPAGQKLTVNRTNFDSSLNIYYQAGGDIGSHWETGTLTFENLVGALPTRTHEAFYVGDAGNVLSFSAQEHFTNAIEFTAMQYAVTPAHNPANTPKTFESRSGSSAPVCFAYTTYSTNDPGPFAFLKGGTLTIDLQISNIVHHFNPPWDGMPGSVVDELVYDRAALTNVNLSVYDTFELRLFAPAGQKLTVNRTNFDSSLNIYYQAGGDIGSHWETGTLSFENLVGALPTRTHEAFYVGDAGNVLSFSAQEHFTNAIEFTAMQYAVTPAHNPANTPKTFESRSGSSAPVCFAYTTYSTNDPGPFAVMRVPAEIYHAVEIAWQSLPTQRYEVQWASEPDTNTWHTLFTNIQGNGMTNSVFDATRHQPRRFYRVKVSTP